MKLREAQGIDSIHPPGTIGIYTDNIARFSDFTVSMIDLKVPAGTIHL